MTDAAGAILRPKLFQTGGAGGLILCLLLMLSIAAAYAFGVYLFSSLVPLVRADFHVGYGAIGIMFSLRQFGFVITSLLSAAIISRLGCVTTVVGSLAAVCCGLLTIAISRDIIVIGVALVILNCAAASIWIPMVPIIAAFIPRGQHARALGFIASGTNYGLCINGLLISMAAPFLGWRGIVCLTATLVAILLFSVFCVFRRRGILDRNIAYVVESNTASNWQAGGKETWYLIRQTRYILLSLIAFLGGLGGVPFISYWSAFGIEQLKLSQNFVGASWLGIGLLGTVSGLLFGWFADRVGIRPILALAIAGLGAAAIFAAILSNRVGFVAGSVLFGLTFFPIYGLIPTYIAKTANLNQAPIISSITEGALGVGAITGSELGAMIRVRTGNFEPLYVSIIFVCGLMLALSAMLASELQDNGSNIGGKSDE
jgi:predicted MFS family arabinose efflux permease